MALNKVEICGVNTSTLPVLDQEEKAELFKRIKAGDEEARELYIKGNLRLVLSVIRRFQNSSENPDDLFQIGCIGLIKAIDNFDTTLQVKFSTYAVPEIAANLTDDHRNCIGGKFYLQSSIEIIDCLDQSDTSDLEEVICIFIAVLKSAYHTEN